MLGDNLKRLRKEKGFSQEELAVRLHVVRQTVSKWEKGLSVPDAAMLVRLGEVLEVPVSVLLGGVQTPTGDIDAVAEQLSRINERLAVRNRRAHRIWTAVAVILAVIIGLNVLNMLLFSYVTTEGQSTVIVEEKIEDE